MLLRFLRFMRGYVRFGVSGRYPERFINITARHGIRLWQVCRRGDGFSACMYRSDYRRIRSLARKSGVKLCIEQKCGVPTYAVRWSDRRGIVLGACAFVVTVFVMSLFIWSVDITGLDTISQTRMQSLLRGHGLYVGAFRPSLDASRVADEVMIADSSIGWMAVNLSGSYASVEVKEQAPAPEVNDIATPCNIKASCDGVILSAEIGEGIAEVTEGSGVIAGQLLVSGVRVDESGSARLVHASAKITARTRHEAGFSLPERRTVLTPTGETADRRSVELLGLRIPYAFASVTSPYALRDETAESPTPLGVRLPVASVRERVSALSPLEETFDENSAKELLIRQSQLYEAFTLSECTVESREYSVTYSGGVYTLNVVYTCTEDIAFTEPIGTDDNTDLTRYTVPTEPTS